MRRFGGDWTDQKLRVLGEYLSAYTMALTRSRFDKLYVDAFAGTGYRAGAKAPDLTEAEQSSLFPGSDDLGRRSLLDGSATIALRTEPPFDRYIFIEKNRDRCAELERLKAQFPTLLDQVDVKQGDANDEIRKICATDWRSKRAVLFLDPYGMQVEWTTATHLMRDLR